MAASFEELDFQLTPMGEISLRRRVDPSLNEEIFEVKLGEEFLMSSLFHVAETALATLALEALDGDQLDVVVGGLGLGYTAQSALGNGRVHTVTVVEALPAVISWHERGLVPAAPNLLADDRCSLVVGDFFALVERGALPRRTSSNQGLDAVLVDIDHTPDHLLHPSHAAFYSTAGLQLLADQIRPGGVFGLWSDDSPREDFLQTVRGVFASCEAYEVPFPNPYTGGTSSNTVYVARRP
ncbi:MAG: spermidine synthase [Acidimicrobiales bacterium]